MVVYVSDIYIPGNSGKHRGPPQLTVHVMTNPADQAGGNYATNFPPTGSSDPAAHQHAMNSRYMSKVDKLKQQSEDTRNYTMKKVDQLTRKAQQLVERFENDEMNLDLKQYDIPKLYGEKANVFQCNIFVMQDEACE